MKRRKFINAASLTSMGLFFTSYLSAKSMAKKSPQEIPLKSKNEARIISTWKHGIAANKAAWETLGKGASVLDAVEAGVRVTESDPTNRSVGLGGLPDRDGHVTLDACIMNQKQ